MRPHISCSPTGQAPTCIVLTAEDTCAGRCSLRRADWDAEFDWVTKLGPDNPKNYQIWVYRKECVKRTKKPARELDFVEV